MGTTVYGDITNRQAGQSIKTMLEHAEPVIILGKFGKPFKLDKNKTDTALWNRPIPYTVSTVPLAEGVTPTPGEHGYEAVSVALLQYGNVVTITDKVDDMTENPVLMDASMLSGEQAGATIEQVTYGKLKAGTSVFYANGAARTDVNTPISIDDQRRVVRYLMAQKAKRINKVLDSSPNYRTRAIEAGWIAIGHTDLEADIRDLPNFTPVAEYASGRAILPEELGSVENVRYILSPDLASFPDAGGLDGDVVLSTTGTSADVYPLIFLGQDAFGTVALKGPDAITPMVLNPNTPRGGDPLGQRGSVGWKTYFAAVILNQAWMSRLEVAASVLG